MYNSTILRKNQLKGLPISITMATPNSEHFNTDFCLVLANQILESETSKGFEFRGFSSVPTCHAKYGCCGDERAHLGEDVAHFRSPSVSDLITSSSGIVDLTTTDRERSESLDNGSPLVSFVSGV